VSPIQLNKEALDGVVSLLNHQRVGLRKIKVVLNPTLSFIGLLPTLVEATRFRKLTSWA
jgi:chromosome partitioning protein